MTPTSSPLPALLGFAFVAAAITLDVGAALLCLFGALVAHLGTQLWRGELSVAELRERAEAARSGFADAGSRSRS